MLDIILQLHKGGSTSVQSYTPTAEEKRLWQIQGDYAEKMNPYVYELADLSEQLLKDSFGTQQYDFKSLNDTAQQQVTQAQNGLAGLTQGIIPTEYQTNMEKSINSAVQNTVGNAVNNLVGQGVMNSSQSNKVFSDISKNVSDTMAEQYSNNISNLNGLYGQQATLANSGITTAAAAQEAAQTPAMNLLNASLGTNAGSTGSALQAVAGKGTTTTNTSSSGSGLLGSILGAGSSIGSALIACFVGNTNIRMADGTDKVIKDISIGDKVQSYNVTTGKNEESNVFEVMESKDVDTFMIITSVGDSNYSVITTLTQPLLTSDGKWLKPTEITFGTALGNIGTVIGLIYRGRQTVYDLKVDGAGTYYANGFIAKDGSE